MSRKNLLISAALTAFVLVIVANLSAVYARMRDVVTTQPTAAAAQALPAPAQVAQVTHQEAANIAANFLGQKDLYSVENAAWNGVDAYKVVFSSGTIVYVGMDGQILGREQSQPVMVSAPVQNNSTASAVAYTGKHKNHDSHEQHDD